jgi:hypothetical protein
LVGENPASSVSTPKMSEPPGLGVAVEMPSGWVPVPVVEVVEGLELQASSRPPAEPMAAMPTPVTALRAKNDLRSMRSDMFPLWTVTETNLIRRPWRDGHDLLPLPADCDENVT